MLRAKVFQHEHKPLRLVIRQRSNNERIDHTQDGGVCPNSESDRRDRGRGETRTLQQQANGKTQIIQHRRFSLFITKRFHRIEPHGRPGRQITRE